MARLDGSGGFWLSTTSEKDAIPPTFFLQVSQYSMHNTCNSVCVVNHAPLRKVMSEKVAMGAYVRYLPFSLQTAQNVLSWRNLSY